MTDPDMFDPEEEAIRAEQLEGEHEAEVETKVAELVRDEPAVPGAGESRLPAVNKAPPSDVVSLVPVVDGKLAPVSLAGFAALASMFVKSGCAPRGMETKEKLTVGLIAGSELGLSWTQTLANIMVVNNKPAVYGNAILGLVMNRAPGYHSNQVEYLEEEQVIPKKARPKMGDTYKCRVTIRIFPPILLKLQELVKEDYGLVEYVGTFSVEEAKAAGLWDKSGPWKNYTNDMLFRRAVKRAADSASPEALLGMSSVEELRDIEPEARDAEVVTPRISISDLRVAAEPIELEEA